MLCRTHGKNRTPDQHEFLFDLIKIRDLIKNRVFDQTLPRERHRRGGERLTSLGFEVGGSVLKLFAVLCLGETHAHADIDEDDVVMISTWDAL